MCSLTGATVSFVGAGTCVIDADQAGGSGWAAAPRVQQSFPVGAAPLPLTITTPATLPPGVSGRAYDVTLTSSGGTGIVTWSLVGRSKLPRGLGLSADGRLSGTPSQTGTFSFTIQAQAGSAVVSRAFSLTIAAPLALAATKLPAGTVGVAYSVALSASGGLQPYAWSVSAGALPAGLALDPATGRIAGTPTAAGSATFTVRVTDSGGVSVTRSFSIKVR